MVAGAASDGTWVALCSARADTDGDGRVSVTLGPRGELSGDALAEELFLGDAPGEPIERIAALDPSGRWLVVERAGALVLVDAHARSFTTLDGADARADASPYVEHRSVSFDASGRLLSLVRRGTAGSEVVVRELLTGVETRVDPGPGELWRAELSPDGKLVVLRVIASDSNGNGKLDWPMPLAARGDWRCHGPVPSYSAWVDHGDRPVVRVAPTSGGVAREIPGFVAPLGDAVLVRDAQGRLLVERVGVAPIELTDARCQARALALDGARGLVLAGCSGVRPRPSVVIAGEGSLVETGLTLGAAPSDAWPSADAPRLFAFHPGAETALVDFETRRSIKLARGDEVAATWQGRALVIRGAELALYDADAGREAPLDARLPAGAVDVMPGPRAGALAAVTGWDGGSAVTVVVDLAAPRALAVLAGRPLALTRDGRVLIAEGGDADATALASGPLRWVSPAGAAGD